jgi:asparagine synthase (glutamine-hydrolysing)
MASADREKAVRRMVDRQIHRGPDDQGMVSAGSATLGMCRLAIFDPEHGHQPMISPDGRVHLVFNGAIYNYRELQDHYRGRGYRFLTDCDTEVLLAAITLDGESCLSRLRGMFAFAAWDAVANTLLAARDPFGIKPLYFTRLSAGGVLLGSEINALFASGLVPREIDPVAVGDFLAWFSVPAPRTIYRRIENLPAGHVLTVDAAGRCRTRAWWQLPARSPADSICATYEDFVRSLRARLEDTVRAHRAADVPVGAFLSGGLDSSSVVGLMTATGATQLKTFSLVFDEAEYSEQAQARQAAELFGTEHHEDLLTGRRVAEDLPRIIASLDQPTGDGINTYYVSQAAHAGGVKVALSGLGGDELFGGYPSFTKLPRFSRVLPWWRQLPHRLPRVVVAALRRGATRARKLADFLDYARDLHELCSLQRRVLPEASRLALLAPEARRLARRQGPFHPRLDDFVFELPGADDFQTVSAWELRTYMADVLLRDSDVFSMAHSLELRVPFIDRDLIAWLWAQPAAFKFGHSRAKGALADAMTGVLPQCTRERPKQGFLLPFARWMHADLRPFLRDAFSPASLDACPWLDATAVAAEWQRFEANPADFRAWSRVWTLAILVAFANRRHTP